MSNDQKSFAKDDATDEINASSNVHFMTIFLPRVSAKYPHKNDETMMPAKDVQNVKLFTFVFV